MPRSSFIVTALVAATLVSAAAPHAWSPELVSGETIRMVAALEESAPSMQMAGRSSAARTLARRSPVLAA